MDQDAVLISNLASSAKCGLILNCVRGRRLMSICVGQDGYLVVVRQNMNVSLVGTHIIQVEFLLYINKQSSCVKSVSV